MSDSIDVTTSFPVPTPAANRDAADNTQGSLLPSPRELVRLVQGLYGVFWGLLMAVFATVQLMLPHSGIMSGRILLIGGTLATLVGSVRLCQTRIYPELWVRSCQTWRRRTRLLCGLSALLLYFGVIFIMWHAVRSPLYLLGNMVAFSLTFVAYLIALNYIIPALAQVLSRQQLALEAQVFTASNIGLILLPLLGTALYVAIVSGTRLVNPLRVVEELMSRVLLQVSLFTIAAVLLPFSLTLALVWAAKDTALRALARPPASSSKDPLNPT